MWKLSIIVFVPALVILVVTGSWWASLTASIALTAIIFALRSTIVVVPRRKGAVIFNRLNFYTRVCGPGVGLIVPFWERVAFYLDLGPKPIQITVSGVHTRDQMPVSISLNFLYFLDPWEMRPELRPQLIDLLEISAPTFLRRHVEDILHRVVGQRGVATLLRPEGRDYLANCLANELPRRVNRFGVAISGIVMLRSITLPEAVQAEINRAHQARVQAEARADALNTLRDSLGTQPDLAWEKVIEVESIDAMARSGAPILFPFSPGWEARAFGIRANGRGRSGEQESESQGLDFAKAIERARAEET